MSIIKTIVESFKNAKGRVFNVEEISVEFPDDVWNIIKEYMIDTPKHELITNLNKIGLDPLQLILKKQFNCGISNIKCSRVPLEKRKNLLITSILKKAVNTKIRNEILTIHFNKEKKKIDCSWVNNYSIGEELLCKNKIHYSGIHNIKSKVIKINKTSVTIGYYDYNIIEDDNAWKNQTNGENRLIWNKNISKTYVVFNQKNLTKQCDFYQFEKKIFLEGIQSVDYGR
jgi:hypothetical protein